MMMILNILNNINVPLDPVILQWDSDSLHGSHFDDNIIANVGEVVDMVITKR